MYGINPDFGIPMPILPRLPPGVSPPTLGLMNQKRLKEKFFHDNASINSKLEDQNQLYRKFASGLFEMAYPGVPPGHPLYTKLYSTTSLQSENDALRKENLELKKKLDAKKTPSKI